jgi:cathepsin B
MRALLIIVGLAAAFADLNLQAPALSQSIIEQVNNDAAATWKAGVNARFQNVTIAQAKRLMGVLPDHKLVMRRLLKERPPVSEAAAAAIPDSFDSRTQWGTMCPTTKEVRDQAACGSCWAFGAVTAMTDRICIATQGKQTPHLSAEDMNSCCAMCGMGCGGGYPSAAWSYWQRTGVVTGGNYNSSQPCYPYSIQACDHHVVGHLQPCGPEVPTPACKKACIDGRNWAGDKRFGASAYSVRARVADIQNEIMTHGPVEGAFTVYEDFLTYRSGVYQHRTGQMLGGHAIKMLGWGVDGSTPYWIVANSWNEDWGNGGFFNILRGQDECGIEDEVVAGLPKV